MELGELGKRFRTASNSVTPEAQKALKKLSQVGVGLVKKSIQDYHAVDTSTMLNSTTAESSGRNTYLIGPTVDYAPYVALGTSRMSARPFHIKASKELDKKVKAYNFQVKGV